MTELEQLPARIDGLTSQISHLRADMRDEFSAVRSQMAEQGDTIITTLRAEMGEQSATILTALRADMTDRDEARATHMRVLYEDVISRIALLKEGLSGRSTRGKPKAKMEK